MIKIAIIKFHALGDLVMASGSMAMLKRAIPQSEITLFTYKENQGLAQMLSGIDKFIYEPADSFKGIKIFTSLLPRILIWQKEKYDMVVSCHIDQKANLLPLLLKKDKLISPGRGLLKDIVSPQGDTYSRKMNHYTQANPRIFSAAAESLGFKVDNNIGPKLDLNSNVLDLDIFKKLKELKIDASRYIAIFPGGGTNCGGQKIRAKQYPLMAQAVGMAVNRMPQLQVVLLGDKTDIEQCSKIEAVLGKNVKYVNTAGLTSFVEYVALINQCRFLVTNDSSALHIATAFKKPILAIFGPTDPEELVYPLESTYVFKSQKPSVIWGKFRGDYRDEQEAIHCFDGIDPRDIADKIIEYAHDQWPEGACKVCE